jgi:hypothetical protein
MWPDFNLKRFIFLPTFGLVLVLVSYQVAAQQLVQDLQQEWLKFDDEHHGFLPVEAHDLDTKVISFTLSSPEFDNFYLTIGVQRRASLFYRNTLIATLNPGYSSFKIDSLKRLINDQSPFLSIEGDQLLPDLTTEIITLPRANTAMMPYQPPYFNTSFSNFIYGALTVLLIYFVLLKTRIPDLTSQYLLIQRTFRLKTIDELIYKISYLKAPNIFFLIYISLLFGFATISFMYFYPAELSVFGINTAIIGFWWLTLYWLGISLFIFMALILKFFWITIIAHVFALNIINVHYASVLRLVFLLGIAISSLTFLQFMLPGAILQSYYWILLVGSLLIIEVILFFKLSLLSTHTLIYIIVYLCATELLPVIFLFKLYTA